MSFQKSELRRKFLEQRNELDEEDVIYRSKLITHTLLNLTEVKNSNVIMCYMDFKNEVMTREFIEHCLCEGKITVLPVVSNQKKGIPHMHAAQIIDLYSDTETHCFGMVQPNNKCLVINPLEIDVVIVPGVAFDRNKNRLGFGKGYYDKFLSTLTQDSLKIGVAFDFQLIDDIPTEPHDVKMDMIITEAQIIK